MEPWDSVEIWTDVWTYFFLNVLIVTRLYRNEIKMQFLSVSQIEENAHWVEDKDEE